MPGLISALSSPDAPDASQVLQGSPAASQSAATAVAQAPVAQPTLAPQTGGLWKSVLFGALNGIAAGARAKTFTEGVGNGVGGAIAGQQQQKQNDMQQQQFATQQQESNQRLAMLQAANHRAAMEHPSTPQEISESTMLQGQKVAANLKLNGVPVEKSFASMDDAYAYISADHNINPNSPFSLQAYPNASGGIDVFRMRDLNKPLDHETDVVTGYTIGMKDGKPSWDAPPVAQTRKVYPGQMTIGDMLSSELNAHNKFDDARLKATAAQAAAQNKIDIADATGVTARNQAAANKSNAAGTGVGEWKPKVTADEKKKAELAENIQHNAASINQLLAKNASMLGAVAGRYTSAEQMAGNDDPDIQALGMAVHNIAMANSGVHGFRSQEGVQATERQILNNFKNGPKAVAGALSSLTNSVQTFIDAARPVGYKTHSQAAPATTGSPVYARNPQTGQRVASNDGGKSWQPVQ